MPQLLNKHLEAILAPLVRVVADAVSSQPGGCLPPDKYLRKKVPRKSRLFLLPSLGCTKMDIPVKGWSGNVWSRLIKHLLVGSVLLRVFLTRVGKEPKLRDTEYFPVRFIPESDI